MQKFTNLIAHSSNPIYYVDKQQRVDRLQRMHNADSPRNFVLPLQTLLSPVSYQ